MVNDMPAEVGTRPAFVERATRPRGPWSVGPSKPLRRCQSTLVEQSAQPRRQDAVLGAAVLAVDEQDLAVGQELLDVRTAQGSERRHHAQIAAPTIEAHRPLLQARERHPVEELIEQPRGRKAVVAELWLDALEIPQPFG